MSRELVILNPFSTKFQGLKYTVPQVDAEDWHYAVRIAREFPEALTETRAANRAFAEKVFELIAPSLDM